MHTVKTKTLNCSIGFLNKLNTLGSLWNFGSDDTSREAVQKCSPGQISGHTDKKNVDTCITDHLWIWFERSDLKCFLDASGVSSHMYSVHLWSDHSRSYYQVWTRPFIHQVDRGTVSEWMPRLRLLGLLDVSAIGYPHSKTVLAQIWPTSHTSGPHAVWNDGTWAVRSCMPDMGHK